MKPASLCSHGWRRLFTGDRLALLNYSGHPGPSSVTCPLRLTWKVTFSTVCISLCSSPQHKVSAGSMNSLPGRVALSLCRRTSAAGGLRLLAGSPCHPDGGPATACVQPARVCHSGTNPKGSVKTKKRGYDITRNPHLNKVSSLLPAVELGFQRSPSRCKQ